MADGAARKRFCAHSERPDFQSLAADAPWTDDPNDIRRFEDVGTRTPANRVAIAEAITFNEGIGIERKSARIRYLKERWANRLRTLPKVHFYSSLDPSESCGVATFGVEGMDMAKLTEHLLDKWGIVVTPMKHPDGLIDGIRAVVNVSLSVQGNRLFRRRHGRHH